MARRRTDIGRGAFGSWVSPDAHALEVLQRILSRGYPLTEDAVFLCMWNILRHNGSRILQKVRQSADVGEYRYFSFSPDIDLLEVRPGDVVAGYELKGYSGKPKSAAPPAYYEGIDQALSYLVNPVSSPLAQSFAGGVFDYVYVVHPAGTGVEALADVLQRCTPLGLIVVNQQGTPNELVKPKLNPYLNIDIKAYFLAHLDAFEAYKKYKVNPIQ